MGVALLKSRPYAAPAASDSLMASMTFGMVVPSGWMPSRRAS